MEAQRGQWGLFFSGDLFIYLSLIFCVFDLRTCGKKSFARIISVLFSCENKNKNKTKNLKCPWKEYSAFKRSSGIQSTERKIRYVQDGFTGFCSCVDGRDFFECMAGPEKHSKKKKSRPADWSSGLEIPFCFLKIPHTNLATSYSTLGSSLQCDLKVVSPSCPTCPTVFFSSSSSCISCEEGNKYRPPSPPPLNTSTLHSIQTRGARDCCPPERFRCSG